MTFENSQNIEPEVFFLDSSGVNLMSPTICHYRMGISGSVLQIVNAQKKKLSLVPNMSGHLCKILVDNSQEKRNYSKIRRNEANPTSAKD